MAGIILTDCHILMGGYDLSGVTNSMSWDYGAEMLDDTVFGTGGTRSTRPGLKTVDITASGFWDTVLDQGLYPKIGAVREVMSGAPTSVIGDPSYTIRGVSGTYNPLSGEVGALVPYEINAHAANTPLVRGRLMAIGSKAATGTGAAVTLGAALSTQRIYSGLHVTAVAGTSIIVTVESSVDAPFTTPVTRLTHATISGALPENVAGDWQELAGPITHTFWRSKWTIVGGPFTIFHTVGIL